MKILSRCLLYLSYLSCCISASSALAETLCGLEFVSPQQIQEVVSKKIDALPDLRDPQYQTYFDKRASVAWAFTTPKNPAHPAVVCRMIVQVGKDVSVKMGAMCGASQEACDAMMATWNKLNESMTEELKSKKSSNSD